MSTPIMGLLSILLLFGLLLLRQPVWLALALCGVVGNALLSNLTVAKLITGTTAFDIASGYGLSVVPLFILMGEISSKSRLSADLFKAARIVLSGMRGGLSVATIVASGAFGAICGSSIATAATMTRISMPEMRSAGYEEGFSAASVATGGTLGILIPPSIILVIYGSIAEVSVPKLFAASLIPGLVLLVLYSAIAMMIAARSPEKAPLDASASWAERLKALLEPWQFIVLFTATIGGIYMGIFSPNEAAAIGAFGAIVLGFATGNLTIVRLTDAVRASVITSCVLFLIVIGATIFANFVVQTRLPELLLSTAQDYGLGPFAVVSIIIVLYIVMGCFLEGIGMMLITVPVFLPVITGYGYDPIWFGVLVVVVVELGLITPPVGMNLFIIQAQIPGTNIATLYRGVVPFLVAPLILILLLFLLPQLTLWLPSILY